MICVGRVIFFPSFLFSFSKGRVRVNRDISTSPFYLAACERAAHNNSPSWLHKQHGNVYIMLRLLQGFCNVAVNIGDHSDEINHGVDPVGFIAYVLLNLRIPY